MSLSIITPHFNDFKGLKKLYECLIDQTASTWQWIIVDDCSEPACITTIADWLEELNNNQVLFIKNTSKSNASVCRNIGAKQAKNELLVFVDADDVVSKHFVAQRTSKEIKECCVFKNSAVIDEHGKEHQKKVVSHDYLDSFLAAKFIWPITAIVWNKNYFNAINGFNEKLPRLQDVELALRVLINHPDLSIVDNEIDFFYQVKPIRKRQNFVQPVCEAVYLLINELLDFSKLSRQQISLVSGYYYNCVRYLERSEDRSNTTYVKNCLKLFRNKKIITTNAYLLSTISLYGFNAGVISGPMLLKVNRKLFKPVIV